MRIMPYIRLMRLHQPAGIWLLFWPCAWGLALGSEHVSVGMLCLFFVCSVVMRGAGCIINDIWDRKFDAQVERTKNRPLASGEVSVSQAFALLAALLSTGLLFALALPRVVLWLGIASLPLVILYPFMKRITWWPQAFLGLTFNWGALLGYAAGKGVIEWPALMLYMAGFFWTLGYDTIYAVQDQRDDEHIGVKSTARLFAHSTPQWIAAFYSMMMICLAITGYGLSLSHWFYIILGFSACLCALQVIYLLKKSHPPGIIFKKNVCVGAVIFFALWLGRLG